MAGMARLARVVVPGLPHQVTEHGNRRQQTFFSDEDYLAYVELMAKWCAECGVVIWAYCLMPNQIHLIGAPQPEDALARAIGQTHRGCTRRINFREKWRGSLGQGRFVWFVMDEPYLVAAARYGELNPVRADPLRDAGIGPGAVPERTGRAATTDWFASLRSGRWLPIGEACSAVRFRRRSDASGESTDARAPPWAVRCSWSIRSEWWGGGVPGLPIFRGSAFYFASISQIVGVWLDLSITSRNRLAVTG